MKQIGLIIGCNFMPDDNIIQMAAKALLDAGHDIAEFDFSAMEVNRSDLTMEQARTAYSQSPLARELTDPVLECHRLKIAGNILIVVYPQSSKFAEAGKLTPELYQIGSSADMVLVQGGTFTMGSPGSEQERYAYKEAQHQVSVSSFHMRKFDVTQGLYQSVMGSNPSHFTGDSNRPVEQVSWYDAVAFCNKLSQRDSLQKVYTINGTNVTADWSANGYRLPTEAEWEYAARGGQQGASAYHVYAGSDNLDQVAWYSGNSGRTTKSGRTSHPVGQKAPNALGLYDMNGNVGQWCWDWFEYNLRSGQNDPRGASSGDTRVIRGGSWLDAARNARVANRSFHTPAYQYIDLGFRLVRQ